MRSRGKDAAEFIEGYCRVTKDSIGGRAGDLLSLRPWQRQLLDALLTEDRSGRLHYRHGLIGVARKNGKSSWSSALALYGLLFSGRGGEVYSCAGDKDQARIVFGSAKSMVEMDPELKGLIRVYRDALEVTATGSVYRVLSSEAFTKEGLNPSLVIFDEVHVQPDDELWNVMEMASGSRIEPLMLGVTTAGVRTNSRGEDSLCYRLYGHGKEVAQGLVDDPTFFFAWWEPVLGIQADHRDPKVWAEANPGLGDIVAEEDFESVLQRSPEPEFRAKRTNVFVSAAQSWLPYGAWAECLSEGAVIPDHAGIVLGFDGSYNNDSTALVAATIDKRPLVVPVKVWEKTENSPPDWTVPIEEVEEEIRAACKKYRVREIVCDPYRWARSMQILSREGLPVVEYPQTPERMVPATQRLYEAVMNGGVVHDGNQILARHMANATLKVDFRGSRLVKVSKGSSAKIDSAIATVMAFDRAVVRGARGSGWLTYLQREVDRNTGVKSEGSVDAPTEESAVPPAAPQSMGSPIPQQRRAACTHRWHPIDHTCVHCGIPRES